MYGKMHARLYALATACLISAVDTGAQANTWRQCLADTSPAAVEACSAIILLDPHNDGALVNRGIAYRRLGDLDRAIRDYSDEAIRLDPQYAHAFNNRGIIFLEMGNIGRALADFNSAIGQEGSYANAFRNRGLARTKLELFDQAIEDFDEAFRLNPAIGHGREYAVALFGRGMTRQRKGDAAGLADMGEASRIFPEVAEAMAEMDDR
jgi:tetratricopeptide (TPR) repeat protein